RPDAEMKEQRRRRIGAQAHVERMAERELPGEPHHHVPGLAGVREVEDQRADGERVGAGQPREDGGAGSKDDETDGGSAHALPPKSPCGRRSRTTIRRPKLNMLFAEGATRSPATA